MLYFVARNNKFFKRLKMKNIKNVILFLFIALAGVTCKMDSGDSKTKNVRGIILENMDTTADPANDFFRFVNGGWVERAEIPADRGSWGNFNELRKMTSDNVQVLLKRSIEEKTYGPGSDQEKAIVFYETAMDTTYLDQLDLGPILDDLNQIDEISDTRELQQYIVRSAPLQVGIFFGIVDLH